MIRMLTPTVGFLVSTAALPVHAQRHDRKLAQVEDSARPRSISGGSRFQVENRYDAVYEKVLHFLKRAEHSIESASKDTGQITTEMTIKGGWSQTGTRIYVFLIKDTNSSTTIRVVVSEQKRKKLFQTEPWDEPKVNVGESQILADDLKLALKPE